LRASRTNRKRRELVSRRTAESGFLKRRESKGGWAGLKARARNNILPPPSTAMFDGDVAGDDVAMKATPSMEVGQRRIDEVRVAFTQKW